MKKRLRKTGEIVDVVSFNNFYQSERDDSDQVSYIDSKGVEHHHVRGLNLWWDFEDIPIEDTRIPILIGSSAGMKSPKKYLLLYMTSL